MRNLRKRHDPSCSVDTQWKIFQKEMASDLFWYSLSFQFKPHRIEVHQIIIYVVLYCKVIFYVIDWKDPHSVSLSNHGTEVPERNHPKDFNNDCVGSLGPYYNHRLFTRLCLEWHLSLNSCPCFGSQKERESGKEEKNILLMAVRQ